MNWLLNRVRSEREQHYQRKLRQLQQEQWDRIHAIEKKYEDKDFFAAPESAGEEVETGVIPDSREKYLLYLLSRVGIHFIPNEAVILARRFGPALAAERVCRWLGLDYHKIAAVAPRVASETVRATMYFDEMQRSCDSTGINSDALLPHIHFGSHDTREILFESFRLSARVIEIYEGLDDSIKEYAGWEQNRPLFIDEWNDITTDCLMRYYNQGILLAEYRKRIEICARLLNECSRNDPFLPEKWISGEEASRWQEEFPEFDIVITQVHLSNRIREVDYMCSREWNRILKKIVETEFDFSVRSTKLEEER